MPETRPPSLRSRLLALLLGVTAIGWLAMGAIGIMDVRHEAREILDGHLAQTAALLLAQRGDELDEIDTEHAPSLHRYSLKVAFQVWERGRALRLHSTNAPDVHLSTLQQGYSDVTHAGVDWRVFSAWDAHHEILVQVAERQESRDEIATALAKSLGLWLLAVLVFIGIATWLAVTHGLRPLGALQRELSTRDPARLAPLPLQGVPAETLPLVTEINRLFARIDTMIERERRFTADAAHELRTPLAVLRTQAQVALAARGESVRQEALAALIGGTDRATRLIEQMLMLARIESGHREAPQLPVELREIVRAEAAAIAPRAIEKGLDLEIAGDSTIVIPGQPELLSILARNLLDNAVRYSPPGGNIGVSVTNENGTGQLRVTNVGAAVGSAVGAAVGAAVGSAVGSAAGSAAGSVAGPALTAEELARLGERFHRIPGSGESGSGLGLSIVQRIAELHGATIQFNATAGGGLAVTVSFPKLGTKPQQQTSLI